MKLLSLYIENYGKIQKREFFFDERLTSFCEQNGYGKSTLASFIKAMLYGLDPYRSNSTGFSERQHFYPFGGGAFGGSLTFSMNGKEYRIERFFGEKSDVSDELKVYCDGTLTDELGADIGKALFGIDRQSFERTAFITPADTEISSTSGINARLNSFVDGTDEAGFDKALRLLEEAAKRYKKSRTGNDLITKTKNEIEALSRSIDNARTVQGALGGKYEKYERLCAELSALEEAATEAQTKNVVLKDWEHYDYLLSRQRAAEEDASKLKAAFAEGVPDEAVLSGIERRIDELSSFAAQIRVLETPVADEKAARLKQRFSSDIPDKNEISRVGERVEAYREAAKKYEQIPAFTDVKQKAKSPAVLLSVAGVIAAALIVAGIVLIALSNVQVGVMAVVFGGCVLSATGAFVAVRRKNEGTVQVENPEKLSAGKYLDGLSDEIKALLLPYGYASGNGIIFDFAQLKEDIAYLEGLAASERQCLDAIAEKTALKNNCAGYISEFFEKYGILGENYLGNLARLRSGISSYKTLGEEAARLSAEAESYRAEKGLTARPEGEATDLTELNFKLGALRNEKISFYRDICDDERLCEQLESCEEERRGLRERLEGYEKKYGLLTAAAELLNAAEQSLKDRFVKPVKDEFVRYAQLLERALGERVVMDKSFSISFERDGRQRTDRHLSSGQRSLCALCFRLALIKNMYSSQSPFLILDDPFVHLDGEHLGRAKRLLTELSSEMQIIYFTCHDSRAL